MSAAVAIAPAGLQFEEAGHVYRWNGQLVPSVTTVLQQLGAYAGIPRAVLDAACERGTYVHRTTELFDLGELNEEALGEQWRPYLAAWKSFLDDYGASWSAIEQQVYSQLHRYAGTVDRTGWLNRKYPGVRWVLDIKTSAAPHHTWGHQTAAYRQALTEADPTFFLARRATVQLRPNGKYNFLIWDDPRDWRVFRSLLTQLETQRRTDAMTTNAITIVSPAMTLELAGPSPELLALVASTAADVKDAESIVIDSVDMLEDAEAIAGRLKKVDAAIEAERKTRVAPFNNAVTEVNAGYNHARRQFSTPLDGLKQKMLGFNAELRRKKAEAEAEEQRKRQAAAAEAAQREADANAEAQRLADEAAELQAEGSTIVASALMEQATELVDAARQDSAVAVATLYAAPTAGPRVKVKGVRGKWKANVTDKAKLLQHVAKLLAAGDASLLNLFEVDQSALNKLAELQEENMQLPGVAPQFIESVSVRRAA